MKFIRKAALLYFDQTKINISFLREKSNMF